MPHLTPTLDHVVVNTHRDIDAAADAYRRIGFTLTPRGYHSLGSVNHLAIFGTDYLELIGLPASGGGRQDLLDWPLGLNGLVWGSEDADATHAAISAAGVPVLPAQSFTRPVELPDGPRDAAFRTVRLTNDTTPAGRLYFCQHFTRDLVWRDEWRQHANGAVGVAAMVFTAADPTRLAGLFGRLFGPHAVRAIPNGARLTVGLTDVDVVTPAECARRFGAAAAPWDARAETIAVMVVRTFSMDRAAAALHGIATERHGDCLVVPPAAAFGAAIAFRE